MLGEPKSRVGVRAIAPGWRLVTSFHLPENGSVSA